MRQQAVAADNEGAAPQAEMRQFAVARQPILDAQLTSSDTSCSSAPPARAPQRVDAQAATSSVIVDSFMEIGLDELVGEHSPTSTSRETSHERAPAAPPPRPCGVELLENQAIDDELLTVLRELVDDGFTLALDDFRYTPECEPLLELARIVKLDVLALEEEELLEQVALLRRRRPRLTLLAEKVELRADFERCRILGFDAFQGYFFARPSLTHGRGVPTQCLGALSAVSSLNAIEDFDSLEQIITRDVGLSLRLLRYANSAFVFLPRRVGSVREALIMLGARQVRRWATVVVLAGTSDAPHELLVTGLVRARMCQMLCGAATTSSPTATSPSACSRSSTPSSTPRWTDVLSTLPFSEDVVGALEERTGPPGDCSRPCWPTSAATSSRRRVQRDPRGLDVRRRLPRGGRLGGQRRTHAQLKPPPLPFRAEEGHRRAVGLLGSVVPDEVTDAVDDVRLGSFRARLEALGHRHAGESVLGAPQHERRHVERGKARLVRDKLVEVARPIQLERDPPPRRVGEALPVLGERLVGHAGAVAAQRRRRGPPG